MKAPVHDARVARSGQHGGIVVKNAVTIAAESGHQLKMPRPLTRPLPVSEKLLT
jgi:hypothetical protein